MKACPLRVLALENNLENIRNFGSALDIMSHGRDDEIAATIGCLKGHCAWWDETLVACTIPTVSDVLYDIKTVLETLDLTISHKE